MSNSVVAAAEISRVAFVMGSEAKPFKETYEGFLNEYEKHSDRPSLARFVIKGKSVDDIKRFKPELIIAVGSKALTSTVDEFTQVPIITCLVIPLTDFLKRPNVTGIYFGPSAKEQMVWLGRFLPKAKVAGILYSDKTGEAAVESFRRVAKDLPYRIFARRVSTPRDLTRELRMVQKEADVLIGLPDTLIYSPHTARHILLGSFRSRVPLIGVSPHWVKAGALYCLHNRYQDLGTQCAKMANKAINGQPIIEIKPERP